MTQSPLTLKHSPSFHSASPVFPALRLTLATLALLTLVVAGSCAKKEQSMGVASAPIDENINTAVTVNFWQFWTDPGIKPTIEGIIADFEKQNPHIDVNVTDLTWESGHEKIVIAMSAGQGPDLLELGSDWVAEFAATGKLADLTPNLAPQKREFLGWEGGSYNAKTFAMPWILGTRVLFYNADLLQKAGFAQNALPVTLSEFRHLVFKVDSLGKDIHGWGSNAAEKHRLYKKFLPYFWSHGAEFFTEDNNYCAISSMKAGRALKYYKELNDSAALIDTQRGLEDAFLAGKVGVILSGEWLLKRIKNEKPAFRFYTGLFPGEESIGRSFFGGEFLTISAQTTDAKKSAAMKLLRFLTAAENQARFCRANFSTCPSSIKAATDPFFASDPNIINFVKQLRLSRPAPVEPSWVYVEDIFEKALEQVLFENAPLFETLQRARFDIQRLSRPEFPPDSASLGPS